MVREGGKREGTDSVNVAVSPTDNPAALEGESSGYWCGSGWLGTGRGCIGRIAFFGCVSGSQKIAKEDSPALPIPLDVAFDSAVLGRSFTRGFVLLEDCGNNDGTERVNVAVSPTDSTAEGEIPSEGRSKGGDTTSFG